MKLRHSLFDNAGVLVELSESGTFKISSPNSSATRHVYEAFQIHLNQFSEVWFLFFQNLLSP